MHVRETPSLQLYPLLGAVLFMFHGLRDDTGVRSDLVDSDVWTKFLVKVKDSVFFVFFYVSRKFSVV